MLFETSLWDLKQRKDEIRASTGGGVRNLPMGFETRCRRSSVLILQVRNLPMGFETNLRPYIMEVSPWFETSLWDLKLAV